MDAIKLTH